MKKTLNYFWEYKKNGNKGRYLWWEGNVEILILVKLIIRCKAILIQTPTILRFRGECSADRACQEAVSLRLACRAFIWDYGKMGARSRRGQRKKLVSKGAPTEDFLCYHGGQWCQLESSELYQVGTKGLVLYIAPFTPNQSVIKCRLLLEGDLIIDVAIFFSWGPSFGNTLRSWRNKSFFLKDDLGGSLQHPPYRENWTKVLFVKSIWNNKYGRILHTLLTKKNNVGSLVS